MKMSLEDLYKFGKLEKHKTSAQEVKDFIAFVKNKIKKDFPIYTPGV